MYRITQIRESKKLSKSELGRRTGIAVSTICHLETGKMFPFAGWKKKLAKALEVDPEILFLEVEETENVKA